MTLALAIVIVFGMLAWAAVADVVARRIPNAISAIVAIAFCFASIGAPERVDLLGGAWVAGVVFLVGFGGFIFGKSGGGDVKLMAAMALWAGPAAALDFLVITGLTGGGLALIYLLPELNLTMTWLKVQAERAAPKYIEAFASGKTTKEGLPYGVAIAIGGGVVMWTRYINI